jgi:para-nitrobenzyl esterase
VRLAEAQQRAGGDAHMYLFTWPSSTFGGALGSFHGLELPFVFNTLETSSANAICGDSPPKPLGDAMQSAWAAFARTGDPSVSLLGTWPTYRPAERSTMVLDATSHVEDDPLADERLLWGD